jgi:hypothetical protein
MQHAFYAHRYPQLILNLVVGIAAYGVGVLWFILTRESIGIQLKNRFARFFSGRVGEAEQ